MRKLFLMLFLAALLGACAAPAARTGGQGRRQARTEKVWLVSNGFHTSIALRAKDAPDGYRTLDPKARYLVIGWGGRDLYMMKRVMPWQWITSTILPTASALHVIPIRTDIVRECPNSEVIEFDVTPRGMARLHKRLQAALERGDDGLPLVCGEGKIPHSRFLSGTEIYYLPKTCNLWAAASLDAAGVPIYVCTAVIADNLLWQGRKHGRLLSTVRKPADPL